MEFRNLEHTDFDTLFSGFERAFSDYEISFDKEEVRSMLKRRGYDSRLSFAAFDNDEVVAFTLNGIGTFNGLPTAYDTGTGTVKEYRGKGLAGKIFSHALPHLREAGIRQYLLEVLQNNSNAIAVYQRMNFRTIREFDCFRQSVDRISFPTAVDAGFIIEPVDIDFIRNTQSFCDFAPSWQNSMESIERADSELTYFGALFGGEPVGFCVCDPETGDLTQIAVRREYRRRGIASLLFKKATEVMKTDFVKVLNVSSDNQTLPAFLKSRNIALASRQYEMMRDL